MRGGVGCSLGLSLYRFQHPHCQQGRSRDSLMLSLLRVVPRKPTGEVGGGEGSLLELREESVIMDDALMHATIRWAAGK